MSVKGSRCEAAFFCLYRTTDNRQRTIDFGCAVSLIYRHSALRAPYLPIIFRYYVTFLS